MSNPMGPADRDEELAQILATLTPEECDELGEMAEGMVAEGSHL